MEHEHSHHVAAPADRVYAVLADPANLSHFVPQVRTAQADGDHVTVEARYDGKTQSGEAFFRADDAARRIEWGTDGGGYGGWMAVGEDGDGSTLTLHLTTVHTDDIDSEVAGTLDAIRRLVEAEV